MKKFGTVVAVLGYAAAMIAAGALFGFKALVLMVVACICTAIAVACIDVVEWEEDELEDDEPEHDSCDGCKHNIGGGCCNLNLEDECEAGGGFEMWEEKDG